MTKLEYLMVYTDSGLPIYSKCFGTFCKTAFKNPELLSGFLSALQTMPLAIGEGLSLESVKMGPTQMKFSRTMPTGHSVVVGVDEDDDELVNDVFKNVNRILSADKYRDVDWTVISADMMKEFEKDLLGSALVDALHNHGGFSDECTLGDQCPMHTNAFVAQKQGGIWGAIKARYAGMRKRMAEKK
ncbi:MAG: hypothetical protein RTU30_12645 [Candidatus Thorarchaeota archaeon]